MHVATIMEPAQHMQASVLSLVTPDMQGYIEIKLKKITNNTLKWVKSSNIDGLILLVAHVLACFTTLAERVRCGGGAVRLKLN